MDLPSKRLHIREMKEVNGPTLEETAYPWIG
jgi:hypothetical protein